MGVGENRLLYVVRPNGEVAEEVGESARRDAQRLLDLEDLSSLWFALAALPPMCGDAVNPHRLSKPSHSARIVAQVAAQRMGKGLSLLGGRLPMPGHVRTLRDVVSRRYTSSYGL